MGVVAAVERELVAIVGAAHVRLPQLVELEDGTRWAGVRGAADLVIAPGTPEEVAACVARCYAAGIPMTVRGGGTGLAGGAVPDGGVVLSLARLNRIRSLDPQWWRCEVEAGVTTAELQRRARESGLRFPPDPGAAESSQIGGNLATNAGGPHAFGHGSTRAYVLGLEAVLAPGELVRIGGPLRKDVAGYDLTSLLVGSEGTLGVITAAWLRLVPPPGAESTVLTVVDGPHAAQEAVSHALTCGAVPAALELIDDGALRDGIGTLPVPGASTGAGALTAPHLLIAHLEGDAASTVGARAQALQAAWDATGAWSAIAGDEQSRALLPWRASVSGAVAARRGGKLSEDVTVPAERLAELLSGSAQIAATRGLEHAAWGHAGDANIHCTFLLDPTDAAQRTAADAAADELFGLVASLGGSVSGEHGLGRLKNGQLRRQWSPGAAQAHTAIKRALDPQNLFGPGRKLA